MEEHFGMKCVFSCMTKPHISFILQLFIHRVSMEKNSFRSISQTCQGDILLYDILLFEDDTRAQQFYVTDLICCGEYSKTLKEFRSESVKIMRAIPIFSFNFFRLLRPLYTCVTYTKHAYYVTCVERHASNSSSKKIQRLVRITFDSHRYYYPVVRV